MNRLFFFCAALLLQVVVLFSCKEDMETAENAVGFSAGSVNDASRAAVLNLDGLKTSGFRVSAYSTDLTSWTSAKATATPGLMYNQLVEWKTSPDRWEYSPTKYWPGKVDGANFGKVSFFAWSANAGASVSAKTENGAPKLTVTVPNIQSDQKDLVTGVLVDKTVSGGPVKFAFKHVLSRIGFKAKLDKQYPNTTVTIKSLKVKYKTDAVESKGIYTFGDADGAEGTWTSSSPKAYMSNADANGDEVVDGDVELNNDATLTAKQVNDDANYLMLLPQGDVEDGDMTVDVAWTVTTGGITISNVHTVSLLKPDDQKKWELGKSYYYELKVSLTAVTFGNVSVEDWGPPTTLTLCELTYDANNGTGDVVNKTLFTGREYKLLDESMFTPPTDYAFLGWNTKADGTGTNYKRGDPITLTEDTRLYAWWIDPTINVETGTYPAGLGLVTYENNEFKIVDNLTGYSYIVTGSTGTGSGSNGNRVVVKSGVTATVTLRNVTIDLSEKSACAFIVSGAGVTLKLEGTNTLKSGIASANNAGLLVPSGTTLTITSSAGDGSFDGTLNVAGGAGTKTAARGGGGGAGIGGNGGPASTGGYPCGTVIINGGTIVATGHAGTASNSYTGSGGAGIGGGGAGGNPAGGGGAGGTVTINKGHVTATGQRGGAGIGGGGKGGGAAANYTGPGDDQDTSGATWEGWNADNTAYVSASGSRAIGAGT